MMLVGTAVEEEAMFFGDVSRMCGMQERRDGRVKEGK